MRWGSLSLRLNAVFVAVLVTAAFTVGYLFDRGRAEAEQKRERAHLRLHAERGADEVERFINRLREDALFLASTPPVQGIRRAIGRGGADAAGGATLDQWKGRLQQIFLSFAGTRPEYAQLRLIGVQDNGRELVRVDRTENGLKVTPPQGLQQKGDRYYVREASRLKPESVHLSRVDLNREHGQISIPHQPTLRAATPVYDPAGGLCCLMVVNMDMGWPFRRAKSFQDRTESLYVADEQGNFLLHPEPGRAFASELGTPFRLADAFPGQADRILSALSEQESFLMLPDPTGALVAYVTARAWDPRDPTRRLVFILTESAEHAFPFGGTLRWESLAGMGGLLALAIVLVVVAVRRQTRSLTALANASEAIAAGDYRIVPSADEGGEVGRLVLAFRRMVREVERREEALEALNRELERRVEERAAELARQHALQQLILENIADGVVVVDSNGHFLLWNRKAAQMVGSGPGAVPPESWSQYFGLFRDETGDPVPVGDLPLVRAIRGESSDNVELYLRNPKCDGGRWAQVTARPLLGPDGVISGGVAVLVDVTEQKRLRERMESHRAALARVGRQALRAEIASAAAHSLSQPVTAMAAYAGAAVRLQKQGRLREVELVDLLSRIETLANEAGTILDKLRALIRHGNQPAVPVDVNQVAESCLDFLREGIQQRGVRIERRFGNNLPKPIGDPIELGHVLIQLISNALEAMQDAAMDKRRLSISTGHDSQADLIVIEVSDTGPGVRPELVGLLFDPWRMDQPEGLGIGLSVARTIVESHGGEICMKNEEAGGATFRVALPVVREEAA
ncbi:MAG: ATP-binding protein [Chromatiaceae bacterium]